MNEFFNFLSKYVNLPVISGVFTFRLISVILDNIVIPLIAMILHENIFYSYNLRIDKNHDVILSNPTDLTGAVKYQIGFGTVLREFIIWVIAMFIIYYLSLMQK
jgi:large-conductance mechanosensitive channel